ncbi:MAG: glycoside hydrolase family 3 C-terminal domain-containing protein [Eubacterium sp.]|nr:glycoside hydrolase family 3 C-terminal domain-containing protein [Eubacterium sp.]
MLKRDLSFHRNRAVEFVKELSLKDKLDILYGTLEKKAKLGVPYIDYAAEAAHGVQARHDQSFDLGEPAYTTVFPNPIGMAATFDKELMHRIGEVAGTEARGLANERVHNGLCPFAPTVDMERDPRWGRNEEAYGEDPRLASRLAGEYIKGMAGDDEKYVRCGATLKHFYGNNVENKRFISDSRMPEDLKQDYYLRVFREVIDYAQPLSVMTSYNLINGVAATFNPEVKEVLKGGGVPLVVSDAYTLTLAVNEQHSAEDGCDAMKKAVDAGVDIFLEGGEYGRPMMEKAIERGLLTEKDIEEIIISKMTVYSALGLMREDLDSDGCSKYFPKDKYSASSVNTAENRSVARESAARSVVLLKNDGVLPVSGVDATGSDDSGSADAAGDGAVKGGRCFAVGPFADFCPIDWYSGITDHNVSVAEGMNIPAEALMPVVKIRLGRNVDANESVPENGAADVDEIASEKDYAGIENGRIVPVDKDKAELFRIMLWDDSRITIRALSTGKLLTTISPEKKIKNVEVISDEFVLYPNSDEAFSWFANEAFQLIDEKDEVIRFIPDDALSFWEDSRIRGIKNPDGKTALSFETVMDVETSLKNFTEKNGITADDNMIACFGLHPIVNCKEERDRESIELPAFQRAVVRRLRETYKNIILMLIGNGPIAVKEEDEAPEIRAILWSATGCEELGNGIADVIYGKLGPAGGVSQTWYVGDHQLADIEEYDIGKSGMTYLFMKDKPLYRFGYGLKFSNFECELKDSKVRIKNTGKYTSDCTVQLYEAPDGKLFLYDGSDRYGLDVNGQQIPVGSKLAAFDRVHDVKPGDELIIDVNI